MDDAIGVMIKEGGGWLVAALFLMLYIYERKRNDDQARDRLVDLKDASAAMHKSTAVLEKVPDAISSLSIEVRTLTNETRQFHVMSGRRQ